MKGRMLKISMLKKRTDLFIEIWFQLMKKHLWYLILYKLAQYPLRYPLSTSTIPAGNVMFEWMNKRKRFVTFVEKESDPKHYYEVANNPTLTWSAV